MRINRNLALDCPMIAQILNSDSHKKTELVVRLAETQLKALGYSQKHFRTKEDIRFVIEMMNRGFISGGSSYGRRSRSDATGLGKKKVLNPQRKRNTEHSADSPGSIGDEDSEGSRENPGDGYLDLIRDALGDDEFGSMAESEV